MCIAKKDLKIKKSDKVQGSVCISFQSEEVKNINITNSNVVDIFGRIGITADDVKKSNIQTLLNQGLIVLV